MLFEPLEINCNDETWSEFLECQISYEAFNRIVWYPTNIVTEREQTEFTLPRRPSAERKYSSKREAVAQPQAAVFLFCVGVDEASIKRAKVFATNLGPRITHCERLGLCSARSIKPT